MMRMYSILKVPFLLAIVTTHPSRRGASAFRAPVIPGPTTTRYHSFSLQLDYSPCELGDLCDIDDDTNSNDAGTALTSSFNQDLERRQNDITLKNWKESSAMESKYKTTKPIILDNGDRIRHIAMDRYPIAVCGGTTGSLYLVDLEAGEILSSVKDVHDPVGDTNNDQVTIAMKLLNGFFVGKGIVSISTQGSAVVTAGREGGASVWRITENKELEFVGCLHGVDDTIVTCLKFDNRGKLWTGSFDGVIRTYDGLSRNILTPSITNADLDAGPILDLSLSDDLNLGACACGRKGGSFVVFDLDDCMPRGSIEPFSSAVHPKSVLLLRDQGKGTIVCGGNDGSLYRHFLHLDDECTEFSAAVSMAGNDECEVDLQDPLRLEANSKVRLAHRGPIVCLTSPFEGIFISAGQDGTVKVWECTTSQDEDDCDNTNTIFNDLGEEHDGMPQCMFTLKGYTPYIGNLVTDGYRVISDGCKNKVNMRDFSLQAD